MKTKMSPSHITENVYYALHDELADNPDNALRVLCEILEFHAMHYSADRQVGECFDNAYNELQELRTALRG
jgi:hypothetical protein